MRRMLISMAALAAVVVALSQGASAQVCDPKDPKCVPPKEGTPCSPGFWKNHQNLWNFEGTDLCDGAGQPSCAGLLEALTCKGSDASCGRSAAAGYLNFAVGGCVE